MRESVIDLGEVRDIFHSPRIGGSILNISAPFDMDRDNPEITGRTVVFLYEGREYSAPVKAVERHLVLRPIRQGENIGLLVDIPELRGVAEEAGSA